MVDDTQQLTSSLLPGPIGFRPESVPTGARSAVRSVRWGRSWAARLLGVLALGVILLGSPVGVKSQQEAARPAGNGSIVGEVADEETGAPVVGAHVQIQEVGRTEFSHGDGSFHFQGLAAREYTVVAERIGYSRETRTVELAEGEVVRITFELRSTAIELPGMVVTGLGRERRADQTYQPTSVLRGRELQRNLGWSLAATLEREPGISMQTFGPAPAQPVIRGMGSDRVLVLEDGRRMGDLSATAPDHAVGVDPMAAQQIEVVRGPAGLLYGSNALGGVVNVIREEVPRTRPEHPTGAVSTQAESANRGGTGAATVRLPLGESFAVRGEGTYREGGNTQTPLGELHNTGSRGYNAGVGGSWLPDWGFVGTSVRVYDMNHELPGDFQGERIPGAHEGGAETETSRVVGRFEAGRSEPLGPFSSMEFDALLIHYLHQEIEGTFQEGEEVRRIVGAEFDQLTGTVDLIARHAHRPGELRAEGAVGVSFFWQDLLTAGSFPGSRSGTERSFAVYFYEELDFDPVRLQFGARYDRSRITPYDTSPIRFGEREIPVRERTFGDFSGSVALVYDFRPGWSLGGSLARAFRTPAIPELFSDGPHLADFSYDVGNPALSSETGLGADLFLRVSRPGLQVEGTVFRNALSDYIYYFPTGDRDPRFRRFPVFEARGDDAVFTGADGGVKWEPVRNLVVDATVSYVRATRTGDDDPLPEIPPLNGDVELRYETPRYFVTAGGRGAARQDRVPSAIPSPIEEGVTIVPEKPTDGYFLWKLGGGIQSTWGETVHSVTLTVENLFDTVWYDHLSRIKDVAPERGRNLRVLYRVTF